ncbi:MAG: hypothetical protein ACFB20_05620 [Opitutales bacterium]
MSAHVNPPHTRTYLQKRLESLSARLASGVSISPSDQELLREQIGALARILQEGHRPEPALSSSLADLAFRAVSLLDTEDSDFALQLQVLDLEVAELSAASAS